MCTAVCYKTKGNYFGRNLDLEHSYEESVVITPRRFPLSFRFRRSVQEHYAIIGAAYLSEGYPLYFDGMNEKGIGMAGLAFVGNAVYQNVEEGKDNIAPYELIPWVLSQCADLGEVRELLKNLNLVDVPFTKEIPNMPLHFMISDGERSIVVEPMKEGVRFYENTIGVLTNNPPFPYHLLNLSNYMRLSRKKPELSFAENLELEIYSEGMGAMGLPGDLSSASRFVRAAFVRLNSVSGEGEKESVNQFFHILTSVEQQRGCVLLEDGQYEYTVYSCCMSLDRGIYYYVTYEERGIKGVDMRKEELWGNRLVIYEQK
ncbi:MAG: choloylglycine hydrolase family protein [Lachnospiraceae bacterium]|nr:choloylglycine hydrolase family protein [Lachnospiraceae bacterium]